MKILTIGTIYVAVVTSALGQQIYHRCGVVGDAKQKRVKQLNPLKNRYTAPGTNQLNSSVSLTSMLRSGNDATRWSPAYGAQIIGYVVSAKPGGAESCNCHAKDPLWKDTHIDLVLSPTDATNHRRHVIVEVTPRCRALKARQGVDWGTATLHRILVGHWIRVTGWMFFDAEHTNVAENTSPGGRHNWRATAWEIHPVTDMQIITDPRINPINQIFRRNLFDERR